MAEFSLDSKSVAALKAAIARRPRTVRTEVGKFLVQGMAVYNRGIIRQPWRMGGAGGGVPVSNDPRYKRPYQRQKSGNLRDTHKRTIEAFEARIGPDTSRAPYAAFVHGLEGYPRKRSYQLRPWLDFVFKKSENEIKGLESKLLDTLVNDLAA